MQKGTLIAAMLLLAGCVAPAANDLPVDALAAPDAAGQAFRFPVAGGPGTPLTAAWWSLPASAVVPWAWNDELDVNESVVAVEASLVLPEGASVERWAFLAFRIEDGELHPSAMAGGFPIRGVMRDGLSEREFEEEVVVQPFLTRLAVDVKAGERIALLVALQTPEPVEASLVFRPLPADVVGDDEAHEEAVTFLAALPSAPVDLPVEGVGEGFHLGAYLSYDVGLPFPYGIEMQAGEVEVTDRRVADTRPLPHLDRVRAASRMAGETGWGFVDAYAWTDAGTWSAAANARGAEARVEGPLLPHRPGWLEVLGEGQGPLEAEMWVDAASAHTKTLGLVAIGLGATLADLTGVRGGSGHFTTAGPLLAAAAGDDLVLERGGTTWRFVGALAPR